METTYSSASEARRNQLARDIVFASVEQGANGQLAIETAVKLGVTIEFGQRALTDLVRQGDVKLDDLFAPRLTEAGYETFEQKIAHQEAIVAMAKLAVESDLEIRRMATEMLSDQNSQIPIAK